MKNDKEKYLKVKESIEIIKKYAEDPEYAEFLDRFNNSNNGTDKTVSQEFLDELSYFQEKKAATLEKKTSK